MNKDKLLIFYSSKNTHGKKDATGAFIPEARGFARYYEVPEEHLIGIDCTQPKRTRREKVLSAIESSDDLEGLLFFCHGWPNGIQFGFTRKNLHVLSYAISKHCTDDIKIGLMACLTAENSVRDSERENLGPATDGGFADRLRDDLVELGVKAGWVDGHKTAGHTSWNLNIVRFVCWDAADRDEARQGGEWIVKPGDRRWKQWCSALKHNTKCLRYEFFRRSKEEIKLFLLKMEK